MICFNYIIYLKLKVNIFFDNYQFTVLTNNLSY